MLKQIEASVKFAEQSKRDWGLFFSACSDPFFRLAVYLLSVERIKTLGKHPVFSDEHRKERFKIAKQKYKAKHRERYLEANREAARERRRDGRDAAYMKRRLQDPVQRLKWINRSRIHSALHRQSASKMVRSIIGCDAKVLREHIESQFQPGMHWYNQGKIPGTWQLDHVRPLSSFDLRDIKQQAEAFHYKNLCPMWFDENSEKSSFWNGRKWKHTDHAQEALN